MFARRDDEMRGVVRERTPSGVNFVIRSNDPRIRRVTREPGHDAVALDAPCRCGGACGSPFTPATLTPGAPLTRLCETWEYPTTQPSPLSIAAYALSRERSKVLRRNLKSLGHDELPPTGPGTAWVFQHALRLDIRIQALQPFAGPVSLLIPREPPPLTRLE